MQRSSESIASLAAALAKAQCELTNPEKSLVGTIKTGAEDGAARVGSGTGSRHGAERLFRYASLASGLDIVRKTLGQHEIATVQTTAIDQTAGIINLTTVLAHASGEWIASDWPVCAIADTAEPHRMGAALTYARRYALFTLVGIAGEDDLDAPDLLTPTPPSGQDKAKPIPGVPLNGGTQHHSRQPAPNKRYGRNISNLTAPILGAEASAQLRDRLLGELNGLADGDEAALWAQRSLPDKDKLAVADAQHVEDAFRAKLANLALQDAPATLTLPKQKRPKRARPKSIDKSVLALPEPRRIRDREHVTFVAQQPCLICGRRLRMLITCAWRKAERSDARSATSSPFRCAGAITAKFTAAAMKPHGGVRAGLIRPRLRSRCGAKRTRWRQTGMKHRMTVGPLPSSPMAANAEQNPARRSADSGQITKQSQLSRLLPHDVIQAVAGQPPQRAQEHRSDYRRRQATVTLQCRPPWADSGDRDRGAGGC